MDYLYIGFQFVVGVFLGIAFCLFISFLFIQFVTELIK